MNIPTARNPSRPSALFAALLPQGVATAELRVPADPALLLAAERAGLGAAAPGRVREFAAGRLCARAAAARLGAGQDPIGAQADRRPQWPPLLTGSITHAGSFTAAAVGDRRRFRAIGIDAERLGELTCDLWDHVLTPAERRRVRRLPTPRQSNLVTLVFSAKEAFYKCQYEVTQQWLEFADVTVHLAEPLGREGRFTVRRAGGAACFAPGGAPPNGRYAFAGGLVLTAMTLDAR